MKINISNKYTLIVVVLLTVGIYFQESLTTSNVWDSNDNSTWVQNGLMGPGQTQIVSPIRQEHIHHHNWLFLNRLKNNKTQT